MTINFDTATRKDAALIKQIATRAFSMSLASRMNASTLDFMMYITAAHLNGCPLDLERLLAADNANFSHDVFGIRRHLDHETGELGDCFLPRFAKPKTGATSPYLNNPPRTLEQAEQDTGRKA